MISNIEKFFLEFNSQFTEPHITFSAQQLIRIRNTHQLNYTLHPSHYYLTLLYCNDYINLFTHLLLHSSSNSNHIVLLNKYLTTIRICYDKIRQICNVNSIEKYEYELNYRNKLNVISNYYSNNQINIPKKIYQVTSYIIYYLILIFLIFFFFSRKSNNLLRISQLKLMNSGIYLLIYFLY